MSQEHTQTSSNETETNTTATRSVGEKIADRTLSGGPLYVGLSMDADTYCIFADELEERADVVEANGDDGTAETLREVIETARLNLMEQMNQGSVSAASEQSIYEVSSDEIPAEPNGTKCDQCRYTVPTRYLLAASREEATELVEESGFNGLCGDCVTQNLRDSGLGPDTVQEDD